MAKDPFLRVRNKTEIPSTTPTKGNMSNSTELHEKDGNSKIEGKWGKGKEEKKSLK